METLHYEAKSIAHTYKGASNDICSLLGNCPNCGQPLTGSRCDTCSGRDGVNIRCRCGADAIGPHGYCADHL